MTLGSLWQLFARETKGWMVGGTVAVLAGVALGVGPAMGYAGGGDTGLEVLLPSLFLCLGGGYAVLFPGVRVSRITLHIVRDWKFYPPSSRMLWILAHVTAVTGLAICILAANTSLGVPGLLVWLFTGPYLVLTGWSAALMGTAANIRLIGSGEAPIAAATQPC